MDQVYVSSLMIVSQEMESDVYVLGSGVYDRVLCNANGWYVVYKDGNSTETQAIICKVCLIHMIWEQQLAAATYSASM